MKVLVELRLQKYYEKIKQKLYFLVKKGNCLVRYQLFKMLFCYLRKLSLFSIAFILFI